jgi:alanyl-tRNA synthetase
MTSKEIRQKYLDFFESKGHTIIPSASVLPENDSSTLFTSSGMQPLIPYLLGEKHPAGTRLINSQKSFRAEDIEEVGDNRHTTFFEMLGNWSLGDYFKKEQLPWIFEFLTEELNLDPRRLYATVFRGDISIGINKDEEAVKILKNIFREKGIEAKDIDFSERDGMQDGKIFYYPAKKNWWSRSGIPANMPIGEPGGPDSEIFYDLGIDLKKHENSPWANEPCHVNCDCGRFIEIANSVFMEFQKTPNGFEKLKQQNVDFGGGLERITMAIQGFDNIFETDLFLNIINKISQLSGKQYRENMKEFEIIADHMRAATFIISDNKGVGPSNTGQGYIVRRLIRRAVRYGKQIGINENSWTKEIAKIIAHDYGNIYPELNKNINFVIRNLQEEEEKFKKTLEKGLKEFEKINKGDVINGETAFNLYQTYGFPIEITKELAKEKGVDVNEKQFEDFLKKHQELSRTASAGMFKGGLADSSEATIKYHTAAHLMLSALRKVLGSHVSQKGSNITAERLRFDFSHPEKMTSEQIKQIENLVNEAIQQKLPVKFEDMSIEQAKITGAMGIFDSKYGEMVRVYTIGLDNKIPFSKEICGGPHVENVENLGIFQIIKEESSSFGVRRIKAVLK